MNKIVWECKFSLFLAILFNYFSIESFILLSPVTSNVYLVNKGDLLLKISVN